jgi:hypothetical protein
MRQLLTILLFTNTIIVLGQTNINGEQIANRWTQGKIDQNGKVVRAEVNRGGWYLLNINRDTTVVFSDPFTCGFGHERQGKWKLSQKDTTITFLFSKRTGYMNSPGTIDIDETEIYKIIKLSEDELILKLMLEGKYSTLSFIKTKNE